MHSCPLSSLCLSLSLPFIFPTSKHPASLFLLSSLTSTQDESAGWSQVQPALSDMKFKTLSWHAFLWQKETLVSLSVSPPSLSTSLEAMLLFVLDLQAFISTTWGMRVISPCSHLHTHPNNSIILCLCLCFLPICCSFPTLFFLRLFISLCLYLSLSPPFIACAVKSDRPDKCGSVVSQIPEASERAKINHFSSSLSSALSLPLCLCSSPFLLQSSRSSVRSVLLVIIIFWLSFTVSFLFQYVAFD